MEKILRSYKYRLYPNQKQMSSLAQFFGAKRFIFNHYLHVNKTKFASQEKHLSNFDINKDITSLKRNPETSWLSEIDDWCLKHASEDLSTAYQNFFNTIKGKGKLKSKLPKFKTKNSRQSYRTRLSSAGCINFDENYIKLPKIGKVKVVYDRKFTGTFKSVTVSKSPDGRYYVSILVEEDYTPINCPRNEVGIDLGLKDLLILSDGTVFKKLEQEKVNLAISKNQKKLSRKSKGSKNYEKQRIKLAKAYSKKTRRQNDYYHNISSYLIKNYSAIYMENLSSSNMMKNRKLSRAIQDASWHKLKSMIQYKASWNYRTFHEIDRFYPSSKTCSCCGYKLPRLGLDVREWACPSCGTKHDRDINAAKNILNKGQLDCYDQIFPSHETGEVGRKLPNVFSETTIKSNILGNSTKFVVDEENLIL